MPTGLCQSSAKEMNSEQSTTNPVSSRVESLNPGPPDDRFNALTNRPHCLLLHLKKET